MNSPPPPPPGGASPPAGRFVRRQHQAGETSPSTTPSSYALDATHRPPPPPPPALDGTPNPRGSIGHHQHFNNGNGHDEAGVAYAYSSPSPPAARKPSVSHDGSAASGGATPAAGVSPTSVGRKLRALRRAGGFSELASVPERLQQWFDGCYSHRYQPTSAASAAAAHEGNASKQFDPTLATASLGLHGAMATFALRHCFDAPLFDGGSGQQSIKQLSTVGGEGGSNSGSSTGAGVDHSTKALFDKWCDSFEDCLTDFVGSVLRMEDEEFGATLVIDKKEEEGSGEANLFGAGASSAFAASPESSPIFEFRAAIAPLAAMLDAQMGKMSNARAGHLGGGSSPQGCAGGRPSVLHAAVLGGGAPHTGSSPSTPAAMAAAMAALAQQQEKQHFYRWNEAIEFSAFVAQMRGTRTLLSKLFAPNSDSASFSSVNTAVAGLSASAVGRLRESLAAAASASGLSASDASQLLANDKTVPDPAVRNAAHKLLKAMVKDLRFGTGGASIDAHGHEEQPAAEQIPFYFCSPLLSYVREVSAGARQAFRRRAALVPLMALWCPLGMDEDIWPTIQAVLSAAGATVPGSDTPFRVSLEKKQLKELTLFRIRLTNAGRKAALAAASEVAAGASPAVLSSPQYLLRPTVAASAGSIAVAVDRTAGAHSAASADQSKASSSGLEASDDLERDWVRFVSVFAEGLDSATFDAFIAYMYSAVLPQVIARDSAELVKLAFGGGASGGGYGASSFSSFSPSPSSPPSALTVDAAAFCASISSPLGGATATNKNALVQTTVQAAARTVKRVLWLAFQQLDTYRKDVIPLPLLLDLVAAAATAINGGGGSGTEGNSTTAVVSELLMAMAQQHHHHHHHQHHPTADGGSVGSGSGSGLLLPPPLLADLAAISRLATRKLASYVKFTDKDRAKLLVRLRNERSATGRDAALAGKFADVTRPNSLSSTANNVSSLGGTLGGGGGGANTDDPLGNSSTVVAVRASPTAGGPSTEVGGVTNSNTAADEEAVTLLRFVHVVKDLVFDPLYSAAHPTTGGGGGASAAAAAEGRHMYWSELATFVEVLMVVSNLPQFRARLRKR